jgi:anthraniloyl-CoA monooxygenase
MNVVSIGGGPAGLYYSILAKQADPSRRVTVLERNKPGDTFGFGVVFSDATMDNLRRADAPSHAEITRSFAHWDDIDVHWKGQVVRSRGHGFAGLERRRMLDILERRALQLGVDIRFGTDVTDAAAVRQVAAGADLVLGADGVNSLVRSTYASAFGPQVDTRGNRFVWLGTTFPFPAFTFYFKENEHGLWRVHAYRYHDAQSTFIVETTDAAWRASGMDRASEDETIAYLERLFAAELAGHKLLKNRSLWRQFPTVKNAKWSTENVVLVGDAVHTAHFSIGSGTKLALEDAIALHEAIERERDVPRALAAYEAARRPAVEKLQAAAQVSLEWFENTERYRELAPLPFAFSLLTRSLRVTHEGLSRRDPELIEKVDRGFANAAPADLRPPPPMFTPLTLRDVTLPNRVVVSPMCTYSADDGTVGDFHLVHLGSRAVGGAGLVIAEMTNVAREGRISPGCAGMYKPEHVAAWRRITDFVHASTVAKIGVQLAHAGRKAACKVPWAGAGEPLAPAQAWPIVAPSPLAWKPGHQVPHELDAGEIAELVEAFARAARRADEAGFDMIELHGAHGYLIGEFLSPLTNQRQDAYGGSLERRLRFPLEVVTAVRAAWPAGKPLFVRISAYDWVDGGTTVADAVTIARALHGAGADVIDVSSGATVPEGRPPHGRLYQAVFADQIRQEARVPTMLVGGVTSWDDANSVLAAERCDLVAIARAHLDDAYFTHHAASAQGVALPWPRPYQQALAAFKPPRR